MLPAYTVLICLHAKYTSNPHLVSTCHPCFQAIDAELDLSDKGLGVRSRRYSMLVDDGTVKVLNMEEGGAFTVSGADDILAAL